MGKPSSFYRLMLHLVLVNFCFGDPLYRCYMCFNQAKCIWSSAGKFKCLCQPGYVGSRCEHVEIAKRDVADGSGMEWEDLMPVGTSTSEPTTTPAPPCPAVVGSCPSGEWTGYYDTDNPVNDGNDIETVDSIRKTFGVRSVCPRPSAVQVRLVAGELPCSHGENAVEIDTEGFSCRADKQPDGHKCNNYKIRFCCPSRVGTCPGDAHWTTFHNRDRPTMSGDWEGRWEFRPQPGGCADDAPLAIEGRIVGSGQLNELGYSYGGNELTIMPNYGLVCQNKHNLPAVTWPSCHDYKVRYCCKTPPIRRPRFPWCFGHGRERGRGRESRFLASRRLGCLIQPRVY